MTARPTLVLVALAATGATLFLLAGPHALAAGYTPAGLGALAVALAMARLLGDLRPRARLSIAAGAGALGFLVGAVAGVGPFPAALAFGAAFLPAFALLLAGVGREQLAFEVARLEDVVDDAAARPAALARADAIRTEARAAARALDPDARGAPAHAGDPRAVYAYAAQVLAYGRALEGGYADAVAALGEVPRRWMPGSMRPLMIGNLAVWHLAAGAPEAALAVLDDLPEKDAVADHRPVLRAARALALVHLGQAGAALAIVGRSEEEAPSPGRLAPRYALVRALSLAAEGDAAAARALLAATIATPEGRAEVTRLRPAVPASSAALVDGVLAAPAE